MVFKRVRKIAKKKKISFVVSVRPPAHQPVRMEQLGYHWTHCDQILHCFPPPPPRKAVEETQVSLGTLYMKMDVHL